MTSAGENRLAAALETALKPPWAIYRNVAWLEKRPGAEPADGEADLVVAHPDLGVMVIEVKGGRVQRIGGRWESVDRKDTAHQIKDPFAQVMREMHGLRRVCEAMPAWPAGRVRFARAVCLPDSAYDRSMTPDGPREIVIDGDDLARVGERVGEIFDWWSASGDASADGGAPGANGMGALHELLARDLEIASPLATGVASDEARIVTLSESQFAILDVLTAQRRAVILGVAGSGKTLLAAEKARRLAAQGFEVLLTCFNRPLAEYLAATIGRLDRVTVSTFHRLAEKFGQEAGLIGPDPAHDTAVLRRPAGRPRPGPAHGAGASVRRDRGRRGPGPGPGVVAAAARPAARSRHRGSSTSSVTPTRISTTLASPTSSVSSCRSRRRSSTSTRIGARRRPSTTSRCASRGPMRRRPNLSRLVRTDVGSRSSPTPMETPKPAGGCWARSCGG